jgi:hypothetical protein
MLYRAVLTFAFLLCLFASSRAESITDMFPQCCQACGITIRAEDDVPSEAIAIAADRLNMLLENLPVVAENLRQAGAELRIVAKREGFIATGGLISYATTENILKLPNDSHADHRDITVHECAHMLHLIGFSEKIHQAITDRYEAAEEEGLWPECYALTNDHEFFAELTMWYFGTRGDYGRLPDPQEGPEWFRQYDPESYQLIDDIYQGRLEFQPISWEQLAMLPSNTESETQSLNSDHPTYIIFENRTGAEVELFWLNFEGERQSFGTLLGHDRSGMATFATHPWLVADLDGNALGIWVPRQQPCILVVEQTPSHRRAETD